MPSSGQRAGDLGAQPVGVDRHRIVGQQRFARLAPRGDDACGTIGECGVPCGLPKRRQQLCQRGLGIAHQADGVCIGPPQLQRIDVDLHARRVELRNAPGVRHLIAGMAAHEQYHVGFVHDLVGRRRTIVSDATNRQSVAGGDRAAPAERRADRRRQRAAQRQQFRAGLRSRDSGTRDDREALRTPQGGGGTFEFIVRRRGTERRHAQLKRGIDAGGLGHRAGFDDVALQPVDVEMHRPRRAGHRRAPRLAEQARQVGCGVHLGGEFGYRREHRMMRNLLVGVAMLVCRRLAAGDGDHRAITEERILQSRCEVRRADRLREADAGAAGNPRVTIGHVSDSLLAVPQHALDVQRSQLDQCAPNHCVDEEHMRRAVGGQAACQPLGAGELLRCHARFLRKRCAGL